MSRQKRTKSGKRRLTVSLSREAADFLVAFSASSKAPSISAALERILTERKRQRKRQEIRAGMTAYYNSLSEEEQREDIHWGKLGEDGLAATDA
jgi:hypothetical protein